MAFIGDWVMVAAPTIRDFLQRVQTFSEHRFHKERLDSCTMQFSLTPTIHNATSIGSSWHSILPAGSQLELDQPLNTYLRHHIFINPASTPTAIANFEEVLETIRKEPLEGKRGQFQSRRKHFLSALHIETGKKQNKSTKQNNSIVLREFILFFGAPKSFRRPHEWT
eukprot:gene3142-5889_t